MSGVVFFLSYLPYKILRRFLLSLELTRCSLSASPHFGFRFPLAVSTGGEGSAGAPPCLCKLQRETVEYFGQRECGEHARGRGPQQSCQQQSNLTNRHTGRGE